jgi:hypothetical protein
VYGALHGQVAQLVQALLTKRECAEVLVLVTWQHWRRRQALFQSERSRFFQIAVAADSRELRGRALDAGRGSFIDQIGEHDEST